MAIPTGPLCPAPSPRFSPPFFPSRMYKCLLFIFRRQPQRAAQASAPDLAGQADVPNHVPHQPLHRSTCLDKRIVSYARYRSKGLSRCFRARMHSTRSASKVSSALQQPRAPTRVRFATRDFRSSIKLISLRGRSLCANPPQRELAELNFDAESAALARRLEAELDCAGEPADSQ